MGKVKTYIIILLVFIILCGLCSFLIIRNKSLKNSLNNANQSIESLLYINDTLKNNNRALLLNIDLINSSNDSLIQSLNQSRRELKIKDKEIQSLHRINSEFNKRDSIIIRDTIFRDREFSLDTTITDKWSAIKLNLKYPSTIIVEPSFKSELSIFTYLNKETIKPPKKCKLARAFQRKHKVLRVEVVDNNPYNMIKEQRFIIIKK